MIDLPTMQPSIYQNNYLGRKGSVAEIAKELEAMIEDFMNMASDLFECRHDLWKLVKFGKRSS